MKIFSKTFATFFLLIGLTSVAIADTKAEYQTSEGTFVIEYRDENHIRFSMADGGYMLLTGGDAYILMRQDGGWMAISAESMAGMMPSGSNNEPQQTQLTATGQKETIAGFSGERYKVKVADSWSGEGRQEQDVVLSHAPETRPTIKAMTRLAEQFSNMEDHTDFSQVEGVDVDKVGFLANDDMRLVSLTTENLPDNIFTLPPNVEMQKMPSMTSGAMGQQDGSSESNGGFLEDLMSSVQDEAANETKEGTKQGVGEAVREGIKGLFN